LEFIAIALSKAVRAGLFAAAIAALPGCAGQGPGGPVVAPPPQSTSIGTGQVKVALILPLSAPGNAGLVAQSMRNSAELALAEFNAPNIQLLVKDDGGTSLGAQQAAQQALDEGAEIILGRYSRNRCRRRGRSRGRGRAGDRILDRHQRGGARRQPAELPAGIRRQPHRQLRFANGKKSFAALVQDNAYGQVIEAAFKEAVARRGGRVVAVERYEFDSIRMQTPIRRS
jgi:ABC-type branched-subunit amino acid transport system substrate-binding protein